MNAIRLKTTTAHGNDDFRAYLEKSLRDPFTINLDGLSLMEVIAACKKAKSRLHANYGKSIGGLVHNLALLEKEYRVTLKPVQVTDVFWGYFVAFCQDRGLKCSTIETMCNQLRSILNWAVKYNATVSPTYGDFDVPGSASREIALTADEVSRITYFDVDLFYADRRKDFRDTMRRVRDMFVLSCNLFQRHSDMVRIGPSCFDRNVFRITQQKTGNVAVVNIDKYAIDAKTEGPECTWVGTTALEYAFIAGAKWQKEQMMKGAVEGEVCGRVYDHINVRFADGICKFLEPKNISHIPADVSKYNIGDKVRIIIVKEDEK